MALFAELNSENIIQRVIVVANSDVIERGGHESEQAATWVKNTFGKDNPSNNWIQGSEDGSFRGHFPTVGGTYLASEDVFRLNKYYPSWVWNTAIVDWESPIGAKPEEALWPQGVLPSYVFWSEIDSTWVVHVVMQAEDITLVDGVITEIIAPEIYQLRLWDNDSNTFNATGTEITRTYDS
tara:strand:- start:587 stop:1129 length:543 start_codon:yes stop_codon:yes gene_type:complete